MKKLKKWITLFVIVFAVFIAPQWAFSVSAAENDIASGTSKNITWVIDNNGKLTVNGSGNFEKKFAPGIQEYYEYKEQAPWCLYAENIISAEIQVTGMTDASALFYNCSKLVNVDFSQFDTSKVIDMENMFSGCNSLASLNLSNFDTSNVMNMENMFRGCKNLKNLDLSNFDTSNVSNMDSMFEDCSDFSVLDLSNFDTFNVSNMDSMFKNCSNLSSLNLSSFDTSKVKTMRRMFENCSNLSSLDLSSFDTSKVYSMLEMFRGCNSLLSLDLSNFNTSNVEDMALMFSGCSNLLSLDLSSFDTSKVEDMCNMFSRCINLKDLNLSSFDTSNVTEKRGMVGMFLGCSNLSNLDLSSFDTSNVSSMNGMFYNCSNLSSLDLSNFDTSNVTTMHSMFSGCNNLKELKLNNFNTNNVMDMSYMFKDCSSLTTLNLSTFNLQNFIDGVIIYEAEGEDEENEYTNTKDMLLGCTALRTIYTPYNIKESIVLPGTGWQFSDGTKVTELPQNLSDSIIITRKQSNTVENNNQNNEDKNNGNSNQDQNNNGQNNSGNSGTEGEDNNQNNIWNGNGGDNSEQAGEISGILEGTGNTADSNTYGRRQLTANPLTFNTIRLSWDAVSGAKSYEVFYSTSPNSGFKRLANVKKTFYNFSKAKCGVTYYFQMRVCQKGAKSEFGPVSYARTDLTGSTILQIKKTTYNSVQLKWSKVPGAKKYEIFYADSMGGKWQSLGVKGGTSFTHKKLVTGATYYYQIRPVRDSFYGTWSNGVSTTTFLGDVSKLNVKAASADRMKVSWKKVKGATQYVILRAESMDGIYEAVGHANKASYIDTGLNSGTTYYYKVYAVSGPYKTKETAPVGQTTKIVKK